jgi:acyl-CoA dehydrogenase
VSTDECFANFGSLLWDDDYPEIREGVAGLMKNYPDKYWRDLDKCGGYPDEFVADMTKSGYASAGLPTEYGGSGLSFRGRQVILETIHHLGGDAHAVHGLMYMMGTVTRFGNDEQRRRLLPGLVAGDIRFQAFGVTEPTSGGDTLSLKTRAVREKGGYRLYGQKIWTSRALQSDYMLVLARTTPLEEVSKRSDGLSVLMLNITENMGKGLEIRPIEIMHNHHTNEVFFDGAWVPDENLLGEQDQGFKYIMYGLNEERGVLSAECIGDAKFFLDRTIKYANERITFGRPISANQGVQFPIARAYIQTRLADVMVRLCAQRLQEDLPCGEQANITKLVASEACWAAAEAAMQFHGGFGVAREYDIERKWRECRHAQIAPISTNLILSYVGQHVLGMPRSY